MGMSYTEALANVGAHISDFRTHTHMYSFEPVQLIHRQTQTIWDPLFLNFSRFDLWGGIITTKGSTGWKEIVLRFSLWYTHRPYVCPNERFSRYIFNSISCKIRVCPCSGFHDNAIRFQWCLFSENAKTLGEIQLSCELKWHQLTYAISYMFSLNTYSWMHLNIVEIVRLCSFTRFTLVAQSFCAHLCALEWAQYKEWFIEGWKYWSTPFIICEYLE